MSTAKVEVEILHACGNWGVGQRVRMDARRAARVERTGYGRIVETATVEAEEAADRTPPVRQTRRTERRG